MEYNNKDILLYSKEQLVIIANKLLEEREAKRCENCFYYDDVDYCYHHEFYVTNVSDFCNYFIIKEEKIK